MTWKLILLLTLTLTTACTASEPPAADTNRPSAETPKAPGADISASPNPIPVGPGELGETTVTWKTPDESPGEVYVAINDGAEALFAQGASGSKPAPWIQSKAKYEFRLYAGAEHRNVVARIAVTRNEK